MSHSRIKHQDVSLLPKAARGLALFLSHKDTTGCFLAATADKKGYFVSAFLAGV